MDCLLILRQRTPRPKFHGEKTFMNNHKTTKFEKKNFPSKVSRYTPLEVN